MGFFKKYLQELDICLKALLLNYSNTAYYANMGVSFLTGTIIGGVSTGVVALTSTIIDKNLQHYEEQPCRGD